MFWALLPGKLQAGLTVAAVGLVLIGGSIVYGKIYDRGYQAAVAVAEKEKAKTKAANDAAIAAARKAFEADLAKLFTNNERLETHGVELDHQADADPAGRRGGISADSVRRIDAIR